jgi:hypothetical protein
MNQSLFTYHSTTHHFYHNKGDNIMTTKRFLKLGSASFAIIFVLVFVASVVQAQTSWTVPVSIVNSDPIRPMNTNVSFGVNPNAMSGIDDLDVKIVGGIPPAGTPGQPYLNAGFAGPGLSYLSTDIRPEGPWQLYVASSGTLTISWNTSSVPDGIPLSMKSSDGRTIDMKAKTSAFFEKGSYSMIIKVPMPSAEITVEPTTGGKDTKITVKGINFGAKEQVTVDFGTTTAITTVTSGADGSLDATFMATVQQNGSVMITAMGETSEQQATNSTFMYSGPQIISVDVAGSPAKPGDTITVTLVGESNGKATFSIAGIVNAVNMEMTEETPGNYVGSYKVPEEPEVVKDATVIVTLEDTAGNVASQNAVEKVTIITTIEFNLALNAGLNLIAVPLADATVEGTTNPIMKVKDLGDALGKTWSLIISLNSETGKFQSFTPTTPETAKSNINITGTTGLIVMMSQAKTLMIQGNPWSEGDINLNAGLNLIGIPLKDEKLGTASDLSALIINSVNLIISIDETGKFQSFTPTTPETAKSNITINGGIGLILLMKSPDKVAVSGEPWMNIPPAPSLRGKLLMRDQTISPVIELDGTIAVNGLSVTARNLSSGLSMTDTTGLTSGDGRFSITFADFVTNQSAKVGDVFEIIFSDPNVKVEVDSIRYTVTEQDIQLGRISLGNLVASAVPIRSELLANFPNPFNPETWIPFKLHKSSDISITIYDVHGQVVRKLELGSIPAGTYQTKAKAAYWDGTNDMGERVASGVYFYQLKASEFTALRKMVILK